ncbi:unnamed protein product [Prorocentrum cordatum]|uniref:Serine aminopeptidase S33 domain-containing protein n=1 Tax=Prorocentrum cordatum TaxID=2364126 RepID=A0ABN9W6D3_9DINO|nr:unnamed protein product [Polarella glacialis]
MAHRRLLGRRGAAEEEEAMADAEGTPRSGRRHQSPAPSPSSASSSSSGRLWPVRAIRESYGELVSMVIRPPRAEYGLQHLGPRSFETRRRRCIREDVRVENDRGLMLECSWWQPSDDSSSSGQQRPCVVYMHGNSSCRVEAMEHLPMLMEMGATLFAFDFAGCGLSEGDLITLGWNEKDDVRCVVDFLRGTGRVSTVALWGRSMGAATALLYGHFDPSIAAMILDSPFADLHQLAREIAMRMPVRRKPRVLVSAALRVLRGSIRKRSGLDMFRLKPIEHADSTFIPALFVAGTGDSFITPSHAKDIHGRYAGDKNLVLVEGDHNSKRPSYLQDSIAIFLGDRLLSPAAGPNQGPPLGGLPPSEARGAAAASEESPRDCSALLQSLLREY